MARRFEERLKREQGRDLTRICLEEVRSREEAGSGKDRYMGERKIAWKKMKSAMWVNEEGENGERERLERVEREMEKLEREKKF